MSKTTPKPTNLDIKHPCIGCKYFPTCGDKSRTARCEGRDINKTKPNKNIRKVSV